MARTKYGMVFRARRDAKFGWNEPRKIGPFEIRGRLMFPSWVDLNLKNALERTLSLSSVIMDKSLAAAIYRFGEQRFFDPGETLEIGCYICNFVNNIDRRWIDIAHVDKIAIVKAAIASAAIPGTELDVDEFIKNPWHINRGRAWPATSRRDLISDRGLEVITEVIHDIPEVCGWTDAIQSVAALLDNIIPPVQGATRDIFNVEWPPENPEQFMNKLAIFYAIVGIWTNCEVYEWIVKQIDSKIGNFGSLRPQR
jgi:hypothetical protein